MKRTIQTIIAAAAFAGLLAAQTATPTNKVDQRKENQQDRIANGVASGQLTPGETAKLEGKEAAINKEVSTDRKANAGKLTQAEKAQVNKQQNKMSTAIYDDKHNAKTDNFKGQVGQRQANQQERIAQGVKSGQLTAGETAKLEKNQAAINQQVKADRATNGGKLTQAEKGQVNKEQNVQSKQIYNKKHNAVKQ